MNNQLSASIVSLIVCLVLVSPVHAQRSCAMKSNEQGGFDSGIPASTLWSTGFTLSAWVMPEYVYAYRGPIFGLSSAQFWFGAGPFRARKRNAEDCDYHPVLRVRLGSESIDYVAPDFDRDQWSHVALTWTPDTRSALVRLFVDGVEVLPYRSAIVPPSPPWDACSSLVDATDPATEFTSPEASTAPSGTLFVGGAGNRYFYGLVDDATIQNRALDPEEVQALAAGGAPASSTVVWRDTFDLDVCAGQIGGGRAVRVPVDRKPSDAALFDDPLLVAPTDGTYHLPFLPGEVWKVTQGYDSTGSHNDFAAFSYDFASGDPYLPTGLRVVRAAAQGTMMHVYETENPPDGSLESNHVLIETIAAGEATSHRHLEHDSVSEIFFDNDPPLFLPQDGNFTVPVDDEEPLARIAVNDRSHLHFGLRPVWDAGYTVPMAFSNYQVMVYCFTYIPVKGTIPSGLCTDWMNVSRGIPEDDTFIRREL
jgi:Concanavalin A-like lectin/glucanases superfamily